MGGGTSVGESHYRQLSSFQRYWLKVWSSRRKHLKFVSSPKEPLNLKNQLKTDPTILGEIFEKIKTF